MAELVGNLDPLRIRMFNHEENIKFDSCVKLVMRIAFADER